MNPDWWKVRFPESTWAEEIEVQTTTLDTLIERHGVPRFCKIDVEGFEGRVLRGLSRAIPLVSFEFTGLFIDEAARNVDYLRSLADVTVNCSLYESMRFALPLWTSGEHVVEHLRDLSTHDEFLSGDIYVRMEPSD
jgi:hypothetical protein